jgi:glycosyltransferase involved in cell wall biosynthesis
MKIFYFSCHAILEYDEIKLYHELGHEVFSAGAYSNPLGHPSLPRPGLPQLTHYPDLERAASTIRATGGAIPQEIIDWADVVIFMHEPEILEKNWEKLKAKRVIFRSIGQCVQHQEMILQRLKFEGLQIVRYSPKEAKIPSYAGSDAIIRFYKDPEEYGNWNGNTVQVMNISQSIRQRADACYYSQVAGAMRDLPGKIYGIGNEDLGEMWGGELTPDQLMQVLRDNRVYVYAGTMPAQYTLSFIEAMMTGIPMVVIGRNITLEKFIHFDYYEVADLITSGSDGFIGNTIEELRVFVKMMLDSPDVARQIGENGRKTAIELFGKETIAAQWREFLG